MNEYKTIEFEANDSFVEKKSRFIGYAKPVNSQQEAVDFINSIKSKHWDAAHNVYAYVLRDNNIQRYSDDGEPSGTAGVPVLDAMLKAGVTDACVVATRYFGGTLLGAGGLVRAYSKTSKIALDAANIITMAECAVLKAQIDYGFYERFNSIISSFNARVIDVQFLESVNIIFSVKESRKLLFEEKLIDLSNGKYNLVFLKNEFTKA